jgi:predicted kinase
MTLIVVSGAPGTGKSTVAAATAADLRWPLLALDTVKEALADVLGLGGEDWSDRVGDAAVEVNTEQPGSADRAIASARTALGW